MDSIFDQDIADFFQNKAWGPLLINNQYGKADEMSLASCFRSEDDSNGQDLARLIRRQ